MNKKIISLFLVTTCAMVASPYAGCKIGFSRTQLNTRLSGQDDIGTGNFGAYSLSKNMNITSMTVGLLAGYSFKLSDKISAFVEGDYEYLGGKSRASDLDVSKLGGNFTLNAALLSEHITVRAKNSFGLMPGSNFSFNDKLSGLFGLRLNLTQFHVRAYHKGANGFQHPLNEKSASKYLFSVEPTLGAMYKFNEKVSGRFTVGYNLVQSKKIVTDYATRSPQMDNITGNVILKPRGLNIRLAAVYNF